MILINKGKKQQPRAIRERRQDRRAEAQVERRDLPDHAQRILRHQPQEGCAEGRGYSFSLYNEIIEIHILRSPYINIFLFPYTMRSPT